MSLKISRIFHAGYVFECEGTRIAFDPILENPFAGNCYVVPAVTIDLAKFKKVTFDAVFISHFHVDHFSLTSLDYFDRRTPVYIYSTTPKMAALLQMMGFVYVRELTIDKPVKVGSFKITPRQALTFEVDSIFQIEAVGLKILNFVDAQASVKARAQLKRLAPWDLVLWPFQDLRETAVFGPEYAKVAVVPDRFDELVELRPRYVVPSSCQFEHERSSWLNLVKFPTSYATFGSQLKTLGLKSIELPPSKSRTLTQAGFQTASPLKWIKLVGKSHDYRFEPDRSQPTTSAIAKKSKAVPSAVRAGLIEFCKTEIPRIYNDYVKRHPSVQRFKTWRLTVIDHKGKPTHLDYSRSRGRLQLSPVNPTTSGYHTEIPLERLDKIVNSGLPLHASYIRIYNGPTMPQDDVLVAALYSENLITQIHQLRRLKRVREP